MAQRVDAVRRRSSIRPVEGWRQRARHHWLHFWHQYQWGILGLLWGLSLALGFWGFADYSAAQGEAHSTADVLYLALQLFTFESGAVSGPGVGWHLEIARFLAPAVAAWTLLEAIGTVFADQVQRTRARTFRNHAVVCGLGRKGSLLARALMNRGTPVIAIEKDPNGPYVSQAREHGVIVLIGDATNPLLLLQARIRHAARVIAVCTPDGLNVDIAFQTRAIVDPDRKQPLICTVHVAEPQLWSLLREQGLGVDGDAAFRPHVVNLYDDAASVLLSEYPPFDDADVGTGAPSRVLLVGLGHFGESVLLRAAKLWRSYPHPASARLRVTIVDRRADTLWAMLRLRSPELERDCEIDTVTVDIHSPEFQAGRYLLDPDGRCTCTMAYVCLENDAIGLDASIALLRATAGCPMQIVVRMREENGVARLFTDREVSHALHRVQPFPLLDRALTSTLLDGTNQLLPLLMHAAYRKYQATLGHLEPDDPSMQSWHDLSEDLRVANRRRVDRMLANVREIGCRIAPEDDWDDWNAEPIAFTAEEIESLAILEHERWRRERLAQGWSHGTARDPVARTYPHLVPWESLPDEVRAYNRSHVRMLPVALAGAGFRIERIEERAGRDGDS